MKGKTHIRSKTELFFAKLNQTNKHTRIRKRPTQRNKRKDVIKTNKQQINRWTVERLNRAQGFYLSEILLDINT